MNNKFSRSTFKIKGIIFFVFLSFISIFSNAQDGSKALRLFVIGNSFSQNATAYLPEFAKERGKELVIGRAELGGCSLEKHWGFVELAEANPDDPKGKPYNGKSLRMLLSEGTWDVVTIQQYSYLSADLESYGPYAQKFYDFIKKIQPNAHIFLHQTWAYRTDAKKFGRVATGKLAQNQTEMWQKSREAYHTVAKQLNLKIIPVGDAFYTVASDSCFGFKKDDSFDYDHPVFPNLPKQDNSLNMGYYWKDKKLVFDPNHANEAGRYLGGLIWYSVLFNESPLKMKFVPKEVAPKFAQYLKSVAAKKVK
ncbi:DUF4886 domain-containing protein [Pedobacter arcticus]|uniref:DUF4886 domain-containing protein n=1 Tax=Pedobacter arcticus TaxID=752140 RepID=UPI0002E61A61|nr:DUF4886 domain-containing protein [Pedobacter arcticus]